MKIAVLAMGMVFELRSVQTLKLEVRWKSDRKTSEQQWLMQFRFGFYRDGEVGGRQRRRVALHNDPP